MDILLGFILGAVIEAIVSIIYLKKHYYIENKEKSRKLYDEHIREIKERSK